MRTGFAALAAAALLVGCATVHSGDQIKAIFNDGIAAYDAGRYEEAYRIFKSIENEDAAAERNVGVMLRKGQGVAKDPKAAQNALAQAALEGLPTAQYDLAEMYLNGEAGPPDAKAAVPLLQAAAGAHHPLAEYRLGLLYEEGTAVDRNLDAARALYVDAAARGVPEAKERLNALGRGPGT